MTVSLINNINIDQLNDEENTKYIMDDQLLLTSAK